ncbi:MAG: hypothetical protein Q8M19_27580 [Reyranella sp.]|nr:hypothetical protein [Reyranella sp.]
MSAADWRLAGVVWLFIGLATAALYVVNASVWPRLPPASNAYPLPRTDEQERVMDYRPVGNTGLTILPVPAL